MTRVVRICAAVGLAAGLVLMAAPPSSAGDGGFVLDVSGAARCLPSGEAEITWTATVEVPNVPTTIVLVEPEGFRPTGGPSPIGLDFSGEQSGAATGPVTFDPPTQTVTSLSDFPVSSEAVALASGTSGGTVDLAAEVLVYLVSFPDENLTISGGASVDLPICDQPLVPTSGTAAAAAAATQPRFTG
jgi:hypothetical protein